VKRGTGYIGPPFFCFLRNEYLAAQRRDMRARVEIISRSQFGDGCSMNVASNQVCIPENLRPSTAERSVLFIILLSRLSTPAFQLFRDEVDDLLMFLGPAVLDHEGIAELEVDGLVRIDRSKIL